MSARLALVVLLCLSLLVPSIAHARPAAAGSVFPEHAASVPAPSGSEAADSGHRDCHGARSKAADTSASAPVIDVDGRDGTSAHACCDDGNCHCAASAFIAMPVSHTADVPPAYLAAFGASHQTMARIEQPLRPPID